MAEAGCFRDETIMTSGARCRACHIGGLKPLVDFGLQPVAHRLLRGTDEEEATFPYQLSVCESCGVVQVPNPISPDDLYSGFNFNISSWKAEPHRNAELDWICRRDVPSSVCEIGANDGSFLALLRDRGVPKCVGVEPNPVPAALARNRGLEIASGFLGADIAAEIVSAHGRFDWVVFRQVFEHVPDISGFLGAVDELLAPGGSLFIDIPDFDVSMRCADATTLWEEHVNYFSESSLRRTLAAAGFEIMETQRFDFSGGCLAVTAKRGAVKTEPVSTDEVETARQFATGLQDYARRMGAALERARNQGWAILLYGAGVRACAFSNFLGLGRYIDSAIDDQTERQGMFLPGARIPINTLECAASKSQKNIFLLAVNNESETKVIPKIRDQCGSALTVSVCGPGDIWSALDGLEQKLD